MNRLGYPDLLSKSKEWKKDRTVPMASSSAFRGIDLAMNYSQFLYPQLWEWVGPETGILVYWETDSVENIPSTIDGTALFGNHTFGQSWSHGYEPMALLDKDNNGWLIGTELANVWVWLDRNRNARVDKGEIRPATSYVKALNVRPDLDDAGNAESVQGAQGLDGKPMHTWDWWSRPWPLTISSDRFVDLDKNPAKDGGVGVERTLAISKSVLPDDLHIYRWSSLTNPENGGFLRFISLNTDLYVVASSYSLLTQSQTSSRIAFPWSRVYFREGALVWELNPELGSAREPNVARSLDGYRVLSGKAGYFPTNTKLPQSVYPWVAELVSPEDLGKEEESIRLAYAKFAAYSPKDFLDAKLLGNEKSLEGNIRLVSSHKDISEVMKIPNTPLQVFK